MTITKSHWENCSVLRFAEGQDPIQAVIERARKIIFKALEDGYDGPPFSPFDLAEHLGVTIVPTADIPDARVISRDDGIYQIEYNPNVPKARRNFSIAHEFVHTFFPDCGSSTRNRELKTSKIGNGWELEMLCNIGAAELLMPIGSFPSIRDETLTIQNILRMRQHYEVSTEAVLLRAVRLAEFPCFMFALSMDEATKRYKVDYVSQSPYMNTTIQKNLIVPQESGVSCCKAIGYTYSGFETWDNKSGELNIECVGIPAYPGRRMPRVVGIAKASVKAKLSPNAIKTLTGDATTPHATGHAIIAHVVNDKGKRWGGAGFAHNVSKAWPEIYRDFASWCEHDSANFKLGKWHLADANERISVFTMIAQKGYGPSESPRIRYQALANGLDALYAEASRMGASVHMPRIGCGHGGGDWKIVSELIENKLTRRGVQVTIYDLPR